MPWPLVFAGIWLSTLIAWVSVLLYEVYRDRQARVRIGSFTHDEPLPRPPIDPPDQFTELDREWCSTHHIAW